MEWEVRVLHLVFLSAMARAVPSPSLEGIQNAMHAVLNKDRLLHPLPLSSAALELISGMLPSLKDPTIRAPPRVTRDPNKKTSAIVTTDMNPDAHAVLFEAKVTMTPEQQPVRNGSASMQSRRRGPLSRGQGCAPRRVPDICPRLGLWAELPLPWLLAVRGGECWDRGCDGEG